MEVTKNAVFECGLVVKPEMCYLAGSPDGVYLNEHNEVVVLEIKCPISNEDQPIFVKYLTFQVDKKGHLIWELDLNDAQGRKYYTQIQINMFICGAKYCDFFVWSSVDYRLFTVNFDKKYF